LAVFVKKAYTEMPMECVDPNISVICRLLKPPLLQVVHKMKNIMNVEIVVPNRVKIGMIVRLDAKEDAFVFQVITIFDNQFLGKVQKFIFLF
jgi:hypothetical protein